VVCTIAPLMQDHAGIEGAMVMAEAGIPVGFLAMPRWAPPLLLRMPGRWLWPMLKTSAPTVLMQLVAPGAPGLPFADASLGRPAHWRLYQLPRDARGRYGVVEMAHHWGMPSLGACYGTDSVETGTWQSAAEPAMDTFLAGLTGPEIVTGMGLARTYTRLYPNRSSSTKTSTNAPAPTCSAWRSARKRLHWKPSGTSAPAGIS